MYAASPASSQPPTSPRQSKAIDLDFVTRLKTSIPSQSPPPAPPPEPEPTMSAPRPDEPADDLAQGVVATARQSWQDLFTLRQRIVLSTPPSCAWRHAAPIGNPIRLLAQLSARGWLFFLVGLGAWMADAFDFHALSVQTVKLAGNYGRTKTDVTLAITLTLLLRSVGAAAFGLAGDRWGRKWPMVVNMLVLGVLQVATIHCAEYPQFLAVRSLFGLFMGGVYGNAIAMALEQCPSLAPVSNQQPRMDADQIYRNQARGLLSGILQQGYSLGYILAAGANLGVGGSQSSWKTVFWIGAGFSIAIGLIRILLPESQQFLQAKQHDRDRKSAGDFWRSVKAMMRKEWKMSVYCVLLMTWFNYYSHASQDSYTTFMLMQKQLDNGGASRASMLMKTGACVGGCILGHISQALGRRRTIIMATLASALMIPAWILPSGERALSTTGFFMQFFVQGAWGVIPIHLNELSPEQFRATFPGVVYQLGNMMASPAAQIVNALAERTFITVGHGHRVEAYGPVMGIATAVVAVGIIVTVVLGPERHGRSFGLGSGEAEEESAEADEVKGGMTVREELR
ncbi:hypothetical protein XA68_18240 [Ophiocordyceps unilateralis]|uniref:Major facilitator superfamily (MFS) profile domain-containing protein n=1 Tax=Ophiocordyceps unilateralis TaxID=268505 RepID=A0A2A9PRN8_OPHUN|nr:hypothetical protein XA68_18240 [Ophiocordyceps unilateralis]